MKTDRPAHPTINARDRIGAGPWYNAKGAVIATSVPDLHSDNNKIGKQTALTEKGDMLPGRSDTPNKHDILTGSQPDGTAYPGADSANTTCGNWVRYFPMSGTARVGHFDREGNDPTTGKSWNSSHDTMGCSQDELKAHRRRPGTTSGSIADGIVMPCGLPLTRQAEW